MSPIQSITRLALAATLWGTAGCIAQLADGAPPALSAAARMLVGGALLCACSGGNPLATLRRMPLRGLALAASAMALFQWTLFRALQDGSAVAVTIISVVSAMAAARLVDALRAGGVIAATGHGAARIDSVVAHTGSVRAHTGGDVARNARLTVAVAATLAATVGAVLLAARGTNLPRANVIAAIASGLAYAVYAMAAASMERAAPGAALASTGGAMLAGGLLLAPIALPHAAALANLHVMLLLVYLGACATALPYYLFLSAMRNVGPGTALGALGLEPIAAAVASALMFGTTINHAMASALLMLATALSLSLVSQPHERTPA